MSTTERKTNRKEEFNIQNMHIPFSTDSLRSASTHAILDLFSCRLLLFLQI